MTVPTITDDLIAELEAAANNAATQGVWTLISDDMGNEIDSDDGPVIEHTSFSQDEDMAFIAKASPAVIRALLAERAEHLASIQCLTELQTAVQHENDELKRDAERYRWLRACDYEKDGGDFGVWTCDYDPLRRYMDADLDSAIDAAMQEQPT